MPKNEMLRFSTRVLGMKEIDKNFEREKYMARVGIVRG